LSAMATNREVGGETRWGVGRRECVAVEVEERESSTLVIIAASVRSYMRA
jgi:hypothetical protein